MVRSGIQNDGGNMKLRIKRDEAIDKFEDKEDNEDEDMNNNNLVDSDNKLS